MDGLKEVFMYRRPGKTGTWKIIPCSKKVQKTYVRQVECKVSSRRDVTFQTAILTSPMQCQFRVSLKLSRFVYSSMLASSNDKQVIC